MIFTLSRRALLAGTAALAAGCATPRTALPVDPASDSDPDAGPAPDTGSHPWDSEELRAVPPARVFPQSVASGDPTSGGVILWTRLDPSEWTPDVPLFVDVADDPDFSAGRRRFVIEASGFGPDTDYTVRVDMDGQLDPDRTFAYRFVYRRVASQVGRCRTLPAADATPDRARFAVLSCQDFRNGYFGAYRHVADADVDFLLHLGDFVYETAGTSAYAGREVTLPSGAATASSLEDFRTLHRTYRSDTALQAALERHTLIAIWDDHEVANDWLLTADSAATLVPRLLAGMQAWWEYLPARVHFDPDASDPRERIRLYRSFDVGRLLRLVVTDERLYRSSPEDPDATMLGPPQRDWFRSRVTDHGATWTVWANEVLLSPLVTGPDREAFSDDGWDGYPAERATLAATLASVENAVVLTGDLHHALVSYLETETGDRVAVEFVTPAVTSTNLSEAVSLPFVDHVGVVERRLRRENPHVRFFDGRHWGYAVVEFTPDDCTCTYVAVDKTVVPVATTATDGNVTTDESAESAESVTSDGTHETHDIPESHEGDGPLDRAGPGVPVPAAVLARYRVAAGTVEPVAVGDADVPADESTSDRSPHPA